MEYNLGFVHIYGGAAVRAGQKYLPYFGMQLASALRTRKLGGNRGCVHTRIIADMYDTLNLDTNSSKE